MGDPKNIRRRNTRRFSLRKEPVPREERNPYSHRSCGPPKTRLSAPYSPGTGPQTQPWRSTESPGKCTKTPGVRPGRDIPTSHLRTDRSRRESTHTTGGRDVTEEWTLSSLPVLGNPIRHTQTCRNTRGSPLRYRPSRSRPRVRPTVQGDRASRHPRNRWSDWRQPHVLWSKRPVDRHLGRQSRGRSQGPGWDGYWYPELGGGTL